MSAFQGFPNLPGQDEIPFCKLNETYCCGNARYGNITTFTSSVRLYKCCGIIYSKNRELR